MFDYKWNVSDFVVAKRFDKKVGINQAFASSVLRLI